MEPPFRVELAADQPGLDPYPVIGHNRIDCRHLEWRDGQALPHREALEAGAVPLEQRRDDPRRLPGEPDPGRRPQPEASEELSKPLATEARRDAHRPDVGGVRDDVSERHLLRRMRLGVVEHGRADPQVIRDHDPPDHGPRSLLQRAGRRDDLVHRSRLVHVHDGRVPQARGRRRGEPVGIEPGVARHGQHVSRPWVHDDDGSAPGPVLDHGVSQLELDAVLDVAVDRGDHVVPGHRRHVAIHALRDEVAGGVDLHGPGARATGDVFLVLELQPG